MLEFVLLFSQHQHQIPPNNLHVPVVFFLLTAGNFSFTEKITVKYAGAAAMYFVSKNLKKKYNITDERAALYEATETWVDALNGRNFLGMISK